MIQIFFFAAFLSRLLGARFLYFAHSCDSREKCDDGSLSSHEFNYSLAFPIILPTQWDRYIVPLFVANSWLEIYLNGSDA